MILSDATDSTCVWLIDLEKVTQAVLQITSFNVRLCRFKGGMGMLDVYFPPVVSPISPLKYLLIAFSKNLVKKLIVMCSLFFKKPIYSMTRSLSAICVPRLKLGSGKEVRGIRTRAVEMMSI